MKKYISTYFYNDVEDLGAIYGNISIPLNLQNLVYWKTVYTFFFTAVVFNKSSDTKFILFTNISDFPHRSELEAMGVIIYDDLSLTFRNPAKWATVKFFFDVIAYIENCDDFSEGDGFILLDTDVISQQSAKPIFDLMQKEVRPIAYSFQERIQLEEEFHGSKVEALEVMLREETGKIIKVTEYIGGEFFSFKKGSINSLIETFQSLLNYKGNPVLLTEEQILTIAHSKKKFLTYKPAIYRLWTSLSNFHIPFDYKKYIFLHLPSEKEGGLSKLFYLTIQLSALECSEMTLSALFKKAMPLHNRLYFLFLKFLIKINKYLK